MKHDLCIIGGAGHVGLPFGVVAANSGIKTILLDTNSEALKKINAGIFPFKEEGGEEELKKALKNKFLFTSDSPEAIRNSDLILLIVGTPIDEYLSPSFKAITGVINQYSPYFKNGQILILRSTVYPGTSEKIQKLLWGNGKRVDVVFCPERIVQGQAIRELVQLPQIISGFNKKTVDRIERFFKKITSRKIIRLRPVEAELAKLYCNAWRYVQFAAANQFFMIAEEHNLDYSRIYEGMREDYPRMKGLPRPGFAAGPCLLKDTMQLSAFHNNKYFLGHTAMLINEGLPSFIINKLKQKFFAKENYLNNRENIGAVLVSTRKNFLKKGGKNNGLDNKIIGILGMSFKSGSDDIRDSLSYKLKKIARTECKEVLCHDPYVKDQSLKPLKEVLDKSDIIILATPHDEYKNIDFNKYSNKIFIDIWNFWPAYEEKNI